jgi:hypothetical protein
MCYKCKILNVPIYSCMASFYLIYVYHGHFQESVYMNVDVYKVKFEIENEI